MTHQINRQRRFRFTTEDAKSTLYLAAITAVMVVILFTRDDSIARDTEQIVQYLADYTKIPNVVTSVILGTRSVSYTHQTLPTIVSV